MSYIRLNLIDHDQTISGEVHGSIGDAVIASLSADPETIRELQLALARFVKPIDESSAIASLHSGENFEPYDAGIVIVDLSARVVATDSTYSAPPTPIDNSELDEIEEMELDPNQSLLSGSDDLINSRANPGFPRNEPVTYGITYHDGEKRTDVWLPYRLADEWLFVSSVPEYEWRCQERREERMASQWLDARSVLFGPELSDFIAREILTASNLDEEDLLTAIHARWLVTPRDDLGGESPREVLLAKQESIDFDLHSRELQWSRTGECPPSLQVNSFAFCSSGFGTHEIVLYYDLIRVMLHESYKQALTGRDYSLAAETERLEAIKHDWLDTPNDDWDKAPALVIECERKRIPWAVSGKAAMFDDDCPVCQAMAEDLEPCFWHLDGSQMEDRFEFSFCQTRDEWEAERRLMEAFDREYDRRRKDGEGWVPSAEARLAGDDGPPH